MLNPDRAELGLQPTLVPESPKKNGHFPRWLRVPAFTGRMFLATLTIAPGTILAADVINHTENRFTAYTAVPAYTELFQQQVYDFYLDSRLGPPGLNTGIDIVANQQINIRVSGKARYGYEGLGCVGDPETDPDGKRYLTNSTCPPKIDPNATLPTAAIGQLIARIDSGPWIPIGSNYTGSLGSNGRLFFLYNEAYWRDNSGGYNITIDITTPLPTDTPRPVATRTPTNIPVPTNTPLPKFTPTPEPEPTQISAPTKIFAPTATRILSDATTTADAIRLEALGKEQAQIKANATRIAVVDTIVTSETSTAATAQAIQSITPTNPRPTPIPEIKPTQVAPNRLPETPTDAPITDWLWKVGSAFLAGLAVNELYKRWRRGGKENKGDLQSQLEELQSQLKNITQDNITLRTRAQELEHKVEGLQYFRETAEEFTLKVDNLTQENVNLRFSNNALVEQTGRLQDEVDTLNKVGLKVHEDNKLLSAQLEESRVAINDLKLQGSRITQENIALKSDNSTLENQVRELKEQIDNLNKELERIKTEKTKGKFNFNPEWITGQEDFERRWQAKKLPLDDNFNSVLDRFRSMMDIIHEISLENSTMDASKIGVRVRAGVEFVIPKVWTDKPCQRFFEKLYDKGFRAGFSNVPDDEEIAKIIYLPKQYRTLSKLSEDQITDARRMYRMFHFALHPDRDRNYRRETNPDLEDSIGVLCTRFNDAWAEIKKLIKPKP